MNYNELLQQPEWLNKRKEILKRDFHRCRNCSSKEGLQVHHRQYHLRSNGSKVAPWDYETKYLITLCESCHKHGHSQFKVPFYPIESTLKTDSYRTMNSNQTQPLITQL